MSIMIDLYRERIAGLEKHSGMSFDHFGEYLKERSAMLSNSELHPQQGKKIAQAVMLEEEDWLDWKIACDFLRSWLGLRGGAAS